MDDVIARIKAYAIVLDSTLEDDDDFLDFVVADVVDRALLYMNRDQLVDDYEDYVEIYEEDDDFWDTFPYPIPPRLERSLASVVVQSYKTAQAKAESEKEVQSISDNGQSITYKDSMASFLANATDTEIFSGTTKLMDKFRLANIVENN